MFWEITIRVLLLLPAYFAYKTGKEYLRDIRNDIRKQLNEK